ncbi:hypothetical protein D0907_12700 [Pseudoalteromonas lipolytica]|jgi:hypothetical protein|uniref:Uncharacterized protein n=1 Tax=Pseudoalteromonas lipolytica TaxID=570156 RepID=A0AAD0WD46_9GAMM|nr:MULTISPECIES: hypothetical protein [Pseudoalteromonas]AXV66069.1 hypothetical protein D0907_12700 [Pseudoalteromonas donghaensis]EWH08021.1 hypothetical protein AT00_00910 [Pseudoalteromonas lipolytica SCSIO 04301]MBE0350417.1 hypothetical protein [Pseudoalteromonas lipolytica LMEB 39]MCC9660186.1 hypothetical protein [Pseudoalteromonas sp. MB41]QLJ07590.1 hypothetical protein GZH31_12470 [Pseudoalteromonas sp. JSTW]
MKTMKVILISLLCLYSFSGVADIQSEAFFCKQCTSKDIARTIAKNEYVNPKKCYPEDPNRPMNDANMICSSVQKNVVLVNPDTKAVYSFLLGHSNVAPIFPTLALDMTLSQNQIEGYQAVVDYNAALNYAVSNIQNYKAINSQYLMTFNAKATRTSSSASCPDNSALSIIVEPNKINQLKELMNLSLMFNLESSPSADVLDRINNSGRVSSTSVGVNLMGVNFTVQYTDETKKPTLIWEFEQSEKESSFKDGLVFDYEIYLHDSNGAPRARYTIIDEASRVAGMTLSALKGHDAGPSVIDNECTLDKLAELNETGMFTNSNGDVLGFNGSDGATNTVINGAGSGRTCTIFFQQYGTGDTIVFRVPRSMCN